MRTPITRPRIASSEERNITAASGVKQKLCTKPVAKSKGTPTARLAVCPNARSAANHRAPQLEAAGAHAERARQRAGPERAGEVAEAGLPDCIDVFGHVGQKPEKHGIGEQIDEKCHRERAQQIGLAPDVAEAFLEIG
jgi:hypothetical protein